MKKLLLLVTFLAAGCAGTWQDKTRKSLDVSLLTAKEVVYQSSKVCDRILLNCVDKKENPCPSLNSCHLVENHIFRGYIALSAACESALHAIKMGDQKTALERLLEANDILSALKAALAAYGVKI